MYNISRYVEAGTVMNNYAHIFDLLTRLRQVLFLISHRINFNQISFSSLFLFYGLATRALLFFCLDAFISALTLSLHSFL